MDQNRSLYTVDCNVTHRQISERIKHDSDFQLTHRNSINFSLHYNRGVLATVEVDRLTDLTVLDGQARLVFLVLL